MKRPFTCDELGFCQALAECPQGVCQTLPECHVACTPPAARPLPIEMEGPYQRPRSAWRVLGTMALWAGFCGLTVGLLAGMVMGGL